MPGLESLPSLSTIGRRSKPMPTRTKVLRDGPIGGEEALDLAREFEPLHVSLALAGRLVRVFCTVVEIPVLAMFDSWKNLALGGSIALEFVGDDDPRYVR
jgi:hypothetical protein